MCEFFVLMVVWWFKPKFHYANFADFVADTNHKSLQHKSRRRLSGFVSRLSWFVSATLSPTFAVHCNGQSSIWATQMGLSRTCHGLCRKHLDMRWFMSMTFLICVRDFHRNFMISWFVTACFCNFHDMCPRLSSRESFSESWRNGIWALLVKV